VLGDHLPALHDAAVDGPVARAVRRLVVLDETLLAVSLRVQELLIRARAREAVPGPIEPERLQIERLFDRLELGAHRGQAPLELAQLLRGLYALALGVFGGTTQLLLVLLEVIDPRVAGQLALELEQLADRQPEADGEC